MKLRQNVISLALFMALWALGAQDQAGQGAVKDVEGMTEAEKAEMLQAIRAQALVVEIRAYQRDAERKVLWENSVSRVTVHGRAISYKLEGETLTLVSQFTPYRKDGMVILMVQTQILVREAGKASIQYTTHMTSHQAALGESFLYYPLGRRKPDDGSATGEMELVLRVDLYEGEAQAGKN